MLKKLWQKIKSTQQVQTISNGIGIQAGGDLNINSKKKVKKTYFSAVNYSGVFFCEPMAQRYQVLEWLHQRGVQAYKIIEVHFEIDE